MLKNYRSVLRLFLCLIFPVAVFGQGSKKPFANFKATPENFAKAMRLTNPTKEQFDSLQHLTIFYGRTSQDTFRLLGDHAANITQNSPDKSLQGRGLLLKGNAHINDSTGLGLLLKAHEILKKSGPPLVQSMAESSLGDCYKFRKDLKKALEYSLLSLETLQSVKDTIEIGKSLQVVAGVYYTLGNFEKALTYLEKSSQLLDAIGDRAQLPPTLNNQAKTLGNLGDRYKNRADTAKSGAEIMHDSATIFYKKAMEVANRALDISVELNNPMGKLANQVTLAELEIKMGNFAQAAKIAEEALPQAEKIGNAFFIIQSHQSLSNAYLKLKQFEKAQKHAEIGYELVMKKPTAVQVTSFQKLLYKIYKETGRNAEALQMLEKLHEESNKIHSLETKKTVADAETKYRTAEMELQNMQLAAAKSKVERQRNLIIMGGLLISFLGFFGYRFQKVKKDRNDKREFAEALIFAQEEERKRIARDLHDGVGQSLLLIKKQLDTNTQVTSENQKMIADTLDEVRSISRDLHPIFLEKFGLTATINDLIEKVGRSTDLFLTKEIADIDSLVPQKSEIHLFRTIQEALSNIVKHAGATAAKITVQNRATDVLVSILDNGKGFDLEMAVVASKSLGIKTMHERISAIGGQLKISRGEKNGTQVEMTIPKLK